jgi:hypothetical protein
MSIQLAYVRCMDQFFEKTIDFAKRTLMNHGSFDTMIVGETNNKEKIAFVGIFEDDEEKELFLSLVSMSFKLRRVNRYVVMSEAWMSSVEKDLKVPIVRPSDDPNKKECLVAIEVKEGDDHGRGILFEIKRKNEKIFKLEEKDSVSNVKGRFTELLSSAKKVPPFLVKVVKKFMENNEVTIH